MWTSRKCLYSPFMFFDYIMSNVYMDLGRRFLNFALYSPLYLLTKKLHMVFVNLEVENI